MLPRGADSIIPFLISPLLSNLALFTTIQARPCNEKQTVGGLQARGGVSTHANNTTMAGRIRKVVIISIRRSITQRFPNKST